MGQDGPYDLPPKPASSSSDENQWAMFCHLAAFAMFVVPGGHILGPLVVWMIKKEEMPLVDQHGKESINFQISMTIYLVVTGLSIFVLIGLVLLPVVAILQIIFTVIGSMEASKGKFYQYPLTIRFIK